VKTMQDDGDVAVDSLELGSFNDAEMKELMEELEGVDIISEDSKCDEDHQTSPDSDFTNDSVAMTPSECGNDNTIDKDMGTEQGPTRVTVDTSASDGATYPNALDECGVGEVDANGDIEDSNDLSLLEKMCDLSNRALAVHAEIIAARDSMSAVQGAVCFAPSSAREMEDVQIVKDVAENLPFLFTHQEAQGYLSCSVPRRYASISMARNLHTICTSIDRECSVAPLCESDDNEEEEEADDNENEEVEVVIVEDEANTSEFEEGESECADFGRV